MKGKVCHPKDPFLSFLNATPANYSDWPVPSIQHSLRKHTKYVTTKMCCIPWYSCHQFDFLNREQDFFYTSSFLNFHLSKCGLRQSKRAGCDGKQHKLTFFVAHELNRDCGEILYSHQTENGIVILFHD